jgi:micrococcal nuclease
MPYLIAIILSLALAAPIWAANVYEALVTQVIDGDTIRVNIEVWPGLHTTTNIRISGMDAPELTGKCQSERDLAIRAKDFISQIMVTGRIVYLTNLQIDKFGGRYDASVYLRSNLEMDVSRHVIAMGLARPYDGGKRKGWCP